MSNAIDIAIGISITFVISNNSISISITIIPNMILILT